MTSLSDQPWQPWNMNPLAAAASLPGESTAQKRHNEALDRQKAAELKLEQELETIREQARKDGYEAGFSAGQQAGHTEGYDKGLEEGKAEGLSLLREQARVSVEPLRHLAKNFTEALEEVDDVVANKVADLALRISKVFVGNAIEGNRQQILDLVKQLMHHEPELTGKPRLHLHPEDCEFVESNIRDEIEAMGWSLRPDELITKGGCRVVSKSGDLDATVESRFGQVEDEFKRQGVYE